MEKFIVIDGNSLINRAYYALPNLKSLSGKPCGAIFGFVNMVVNLLLTEKPKYLVCVFDAGKHTFRHDMYAEYKGKRDKMPEDLHAQLVELKDLLRTMGIMIKEIPEIEADDIVGSISRKFNEEFILVSGDKDLLQLVNKNTTVWLTQKGISNVLKVNEQVLEEEFKIKPYQVIEMKAIMGDSSDNIPGVVGIGKVGAEKLIAEYKDLDNVYANLEKHPAGIQRKLIESKDLAYLSKQLATIKLDVDLDFTVEDCEYKLPFNEQVRLVMEDLGFKSLLNRKELFDKSSVKKEVAEINLEAEIIEIDDEQKFKDMLKCLNSSFAVTIDDLTLRLATEEKEFILYTSGEIFNLNIDLIQKLFANDNQKICFDAKGLMHELGHFGIEINNYFDTSISIYVANEMDAEITLDDALKLNNIVTNAKK